MIELQVVTLKFGIFSNMRNLYYHIVDFSHSIIKLLDKSDYYRVSKKKYLTELELATYFGRSTRWVYERLRKGGALMEGKHFFDVCGVKLYKIEQIEADIESGSIK